MQTVGITYFNTDFVLNTSFDSPAITASAGCRMARSKVIR